MVNTSIGIRNRRLTKGSLDVPVSPLRIVEHKIGFKEVIGCVCGARLDLNHATRAERKAFTGLHEQCVTQE
jgi:hypothetical protein